MHQTSAKIFCVGFLIIFLASPTVAFLDFLDPFGIFSGTEVEEKVDIEEKVKFEQKPVTENLKTIENLEKTEITIPTSGEFNSSFLIVGKSRPLKLQCYFNINILCLMDEQIDINVVTVVEFISGTGEIQ